MTIRRNLLALALLGGAAIFLPPHASFAAGDTPPAAKSESVGAALVERYVAAVNAHDTSTFPDLFTQSYIQHSGRSLSGLAAQIENFRGLFAAFPDVRMQTEDVIVAGDKVVARNTYAATDTQSVGGAAPTGKPFSFRTIDIWRVENGKLAEHWDLTERAEVLRKLREN